MFRLAERTYEEGLAQHRGDPVRVYESDPVQAERIHRARLMLNRAARAVDCDLPIRVIELGCGTGDISGIFSKPGTVPYSVTGIDCSEAAIAKARERFPDGEWHVAPIEGFFERPFDVIVLCEVLEHIEDPQGLVKRWLPQCQASVISHPVDEPKGSTLSGGDHCWSLSERDFRKWFDLGGHVLEEFEWLRVGQYRVAIGRGRRK